MACGEDAAANVARAEALVRDAAAQGAQIVLLQELFETPYFCKDTDSAHFRLARPADSHPTIAHMRHLARELRVVLPLSFFERADNVHYNSLALIDADGRNLGVYRKSHIPDSPGYHEKFYFSPGDTGFRVWDTQAARIGVGICWDQWFPEAARIMALAGAEILFYPTAIGSEPQDATLDTRGQWQRVMQGHAAANLVPVVASNRIGTERGQDWTVTFYGSSFITDHMGAKVQEAASDGAAVLVQRFDLDAIRAARISWGVYRDRRPDLYGPLLRPHGATT
jgi:N-carbamoylputrescine amidase